MKRNLQRNAKSFWTTSSEGRLKSERESRAIGRPRIELQDEVPHIVSFYRQPAGHRLFDSGVNARINPSAVSQIVFASPFYVWPQAGVTLEYSSA